MKKHIKRIPWLLALVMLMTIALPITAGAAGTGSITIVPPAGLTIDASNFSAFKLFDLTITGTDPDLNYVYTPASAVESFLAETGMAAKYGAAGLTGPAAAEAFRQWLQDAARTDADLIALAKDLTNSASVSAALGGANVGGNVEIGNLDDGYYLVMGKAQRSDKAGEYIISRSMLVNVPGPSGSRDVNVNLKADRPAIEKEVKNGAEWGEETDQSIGDKVDYRITTAIPDLDGYDLSEYIFKITDSLSAGLTLVTDATGGSSATAFEKGFDIVVTVGGTETTDFLLTTDNASGFTITLGDPGNKNFPFTAGSAVVVTYSATLNENAVIASTGNENSAKLVYSNNPNWNGTGAQPTGETPPDEPRVYTFDINVLKVNGADNDDTLSGAEFKLKTSESGTGLWFTVSGSVYTLAETQESGGSRVQTLISGSDGTIAIRGLDAGTYYLEETKAPTGFNLLDTDEVITIAHAEAGDYTVNGVAGASSEVMVENNTGGQLPGTGGIGTYLFFAAGGVMALLLVAAYVIYRKKRNINALNA